MRHANHVGGWINVGPRLEESKGSDQNKHVLKYYRRGVVAAAGLQTWSSSFHLTLYSVYTTSVYKCGQGSSLFCAESVPVLRAHQTNTGFARIWSTCSCWLMRPQPLLSHMMAPAVVVPDLLSSVCEDYNVVPKAERQSGSSC